MDEHMPALVAPDAHILIVDDNDMNLGVIADLLEDTKIQVTTAESGKECIELLQERRFDVVFLDQMMPGMTGTETLEEINRQQLLNGTPVIALTADAIVGGKESYTKEGFTDYLSKPVIYKDMEAILIKYLEPALVYKAE